MQEQITAKREQGEMDEALRLQDILREKMQEGRRSRGLGEENDRDYEERIHERIRNHHEERRRQRRLEDRVPSSKSQRNEAPPDVDTSGLSDERAIYHMTQIARKASIITDKLSRFRGAFSDEEVQKFKQQVEEYKTLERVVAGYLQQTADEFYKAKKMNTKEKRLAQIERAKAAKNLRKDDEKAAREAARDKFLSIKKVVDAKVDEYRKEL